MSGSEHPGYTLHRGDSPLLISVPHCGTAVPAELEARLVPAARTLPDTDWHVHELYAFAPELGATCLFAHYSRYLIDLNRDPSGASLYPGKSVTELCPTTAFDGSELYTPGRAPDAREQALRVRQYFEPYHSMLQTELERLQALHGFAVLLDGHSIRAEVPRFFEGRLPDLNLGTADGASCAGELTALACGVLEASGMSWIANGRFKGGYITRHFGRPEAQVHALQLEMAQAAYMDEAPPFAWDASRAAPLRKVLEQLVGALLAWRPTNAGRSPA